MSFLTLPENKIRDKNSMMFHVLPVIGTAIGAGGAGILGALGSGMFNTSAANKAAGAQGKASKQFKKQQKKNVQAYTQGQQQVQGMLNETQAPQYNLGAMLGDAGQISNYYRQQLEAFQPGAAQQRQQATNQIGQAMDVISNYLRGEIPQDVKDQIMRNVAESAGAGFNPATAGQAGGFQAAQGQFARNLGLISLDIQGRGLSAIPSIQGTAQNWQQLAKAFTAEPLDVGRLQLGYQTAGAEIGLRKANAMSDMFSNIYNAQSGLASQIYGANKENAAASYAAQQAVGQGFSDVGKAGTGALMGASYASAAQQGLGGGYSQYATMGGYGSLQEAQQTAKAYKPFGNYGSMIIRGA